MADSSTRHPSNLAVKLTVRALAKELVWRVATSHTPEPGVNDIAVFATRRGGSTWIMEMIGANRGVRPLNQPLETLSRNLTLGQATEIPKFDQGQITSLPDLERERLHDVISKLLSGELVFNAPVKFWARGFTFKSNRHVLKITDAKPVIGWFSDTFAIDVVYLTRHPIPQALSCIRNKWTLTVRPFLQDERYIAEHLTGVQVDRCRQVMTTGTYLEQFVLNWALENLPPLRLLPTRPEWTHVSYERCVADPVSVVETLAARLHLNDREAMLATIRRPSGSSRRSTASVRDKISTGEGRATLDGWRSAIAANELTSCSRLLDDLGIDLDMLDVNP